VLWETQVSLSFPFLGGSSGVQSSQYSPLGNKAEVRNRTGIKFGEQERTRLNVDKRCGKWMHFIGNGSLRNQVNRLFHQAECRIPQGHSLRAARLCPGSTNYLISVVVVVLVRFSSLLGLSVVVVVFRLSWCCFRWWCFRFSLVVVVVF
jgi:hypothetical protein